MGRILSIDYGRKRTGIAVTDEFQIIATGLTTVPSNDVLKFIKNYIKTENPPGDRSTVGRVSASQFGHLFSLTAARMWPAYHLEVSV